MAIRITTIAATTPATTIRQRESLAPRLACRLGLLQLLAFGARLLAALLACEVLTVALDRSIHAKNFYTFLLNGA